MKKILMVTLCMSILGSYNVYAAPEVNIYVSQNGSNNNDGTIERPLKTLNAARQKIKTMGVKGNVNVNIRGGEYKFDSSFNMGQYDCFDNYTITFKAYNNEKVIFTGADDVDKIVPLPAECAVPDKIKPYVKAVDISAFGNICDYSDFTNVSELVCDNIIMDYAKYPNEGYLYTDEIISKGDTTGAKFVCNDQITTSLENKENIYIGGNLVQEWFWNFNNVKSIKNNIVETELPLTVGNIKGIRSKMPYYLTNSEAFIDVPGEYFIDKNKKMIYFYPKENSDNSRIQIITLKDPMINLNKARNITFNNITFINGKNCAINTTNCTNVNIENCIIKNFGQTAANFWKSKNCSVKNSLIYDIGNKGINVSGGNIETMEPSGFRLENCEIGKTGRINKNQATALWTHSYDGGTGAYIGHNKFYDMPFQAVGLSFESIIEYNEIYDVCNASGDMGAVYSGQSFVNCRGGEVRNNYIHDIPCNFEYTNFGTNGIYMDGSAGTKVYNNVVANVNRNFYYSSGGGANEVYNNIFVGNEKAKIFTKYPDSSQTIRIMDYNLDQTSEDVKKTIGQYTYTSDLWIKKYPEIKKALDSGKPMIPSHKIYNNILYRCGKTAIAESTYQSPFTVVENNWQKRENPGFKDLKMKNYQLKPNARVYCPLPEFRVIDMSQIGLIK